MAIGETERLICSVIRRETTPWNGSGDATAIDAFLEAGRYQGVLPLLDTEFSSGKDFATWPDEILTASHQAALAQTGYELAHGGEIERVLAALSRAAITPLLLKGTGLAYALYASPVLRPRSDSDLLVAPEMRENAWRALQKLGYRRVGGPAGKFVGYQMQLQCRDARNLVHNIDLHWRISDAQSFAWLFSFADLAAAAVPVPALDPGASRLGNVHALLLCLLHRAGNNLFQAPGFGDRLIWLYDIHLLVEAMTERQLDDFRATVETKRVGAITLQGLRQCAGRFPSPRLADLIDVLLGSAQAQSGAEFLGAVRLRREWMELRAIPRAASRFNYLAERAFPSREYVRERYPESSASPLPLLHARRWLEGLGKMVRARRR